MHLIHSNEIVAENIGKMVVEAEYTAAHRKAGQFVIIIIDEFGERIPLTIAGADKSAGTITLFYQIVGKSTLKLSMLKKGDFLKDVAGPLGHATEVKKYGNVLCVGGGIGIAPVYPIADAMKEAGNKVYGVIGARSGSLLILEDELSQLCDTFQVFTDDGSSGRKGFVTEGISELLEKESIDLVVAVGPVPMMKAVSDITKSKGIKTFVSLNSVMVDGTGMCGGCRVTVGNEVKFTCVDGPEFDGHLVDFDELVLRLNTYNEQETSSYKEHKHKCRLDGVINNGR